MDKKKTLIVYSSLTGNTKKLARAIHQVLDQEADLYNLKEKPDWSLYDNIIVGYWARRAGADYAMRDYMEEIEGKTCGIFATCGTYEDSDHARRVIDFGRELLESNGNLVLETFICQGRVHRTRKMVHQIYPEGHPYHLEEETRKRHLSAYTRPDQEDLKRVQEVFRNFPSKKPGP